MLILTVPATGRVRVASAIGWWAGSPECAGSRWYGIARWCAASLKRLGLTGTSQKTAPP